MTEPTGTYQSEVRELEIDGEQFTLSAITNPEGGTTASLWSPEGGFVPMLAELFAETFIEQGGQNYVACRVYHERLGHLELVLQRVEGLTPAEKLRRAEQRIAELEMLLHRAKGGTE